MRRSSVFTAAVLFLVVIHIAVNAQDAGNKPTPKVGAQPAPKSDSPAPKVGAQRAPTTDSPTPKIGAQRAPTPDSAKEPAGKNPADKTPAANGNAAPVPPAEQSPDEKAIRQTGETYVKAFNQHDAKALAEHFTPEAEYVAESGTLFQGRPAIEKSLEEFFAEFPGAKVELQIDSIRIIGSGTAVEDGMVRIARAKDAEPVVTRYTAVHSKTSGMWLVASVRDFPVKSPRQHRNQLKQLEWMLGDWVHEGSDAVVTFSCKPVDNGNFLLRSFTIKIGGENVMSGSQRIGWDASSHKFRTWTFDSDGGHSEGYWHRDGDSWVLKSAGVTADGHTASSTTIYTFVNVKTMTFQSIDHEVSGIELPDGPKVTIVRHAPHPE